MKVTAYLQGGLGNQCFIYAAARALSERTGAPLGLDFGCFEDDHLFHRHFMLDALRCTVAYTGTNPYWWRKIVNRTALTRAKWLWRLIHLAQEDAPRVFTELPSAWCGELLLYGFRQSERYFSACAPIIADAFRLKDESWLDRDEIARAIREAKVSVFAHVRSYIDIPGKQDHSAALPIAYYKRAFARLAEEVGSATVFVFSDDLPWTEEWFKREIEPTSGGLTFVYVRSCDVVKSDGSTLPETLRDFALMRLCTHGIVANSTFSWWSGWLGEFDACARGEVPVRFCPSSSPIERDFYPSRWHHVEWTSPDGE